MPTTAGSTARGLPYPGDTGTSPDGPASFKALADAIETMMNSALVLGSTLTALTTITAQGTGTSGLVLLSSSSGADLKRSRLLNDTGVTRLQSLTDAFAALKTGLTMDHATGVVDFPNGLTESTRRGKSIVATEESRTNTGYGTLTTPDQVTVVLPADGLITVSYRALVKNSVGAAGTVAIFFGADQVKMPTGTGAPSVAAVLIGGDTDYNVVRTAPALAAGMENFPGAGDASTVTTGLLSGQPIQIEAAAGTYTVSVQYKSTSGSVTAKERKLWVKAEAY